MDKRSCWAGFRWVWWVRKGDGRVFGGSVDSGCHKLSENIWFVWSRTPYSGEKVGCDACPRTDRRTDCEDRARFLKQNSQKELLSGEDIEFICKLLKPYSLDLFF